MNLDDVCLYLTLGEVRFFSSIFFGGIWHGFFMAKKSELGPPETTLNFRNFPSTRWLDARSDRTRDGSSSASSAVSFWYLWKENDSANG